MDSYQKMVVEVLHTANWLDTGICEVLGQYGLTHPQFNVLRILESEYPEPISAGCIKEKILFSKSDVTRLTDRLVDKSLVNRTLCPDNRRKMDITITEKGQGVINEILPKLKTKLFNYFEQHISNEEKEVLIRLMRNMRSVKKEEIIL